jgi:transcription elongation factor GreA
MHTVLLSNLSHVFYFFMEYYLTPERLEALKKEHEHLTTEKRREVAKRLKRAKELGDLSENSEYFEAREEQSRVESRILEVEHMIKNAKIIEETHDSHVRIGSVIEVKKGNDDTRTFRIVGSTEVEPEKGLISNESPLGKAFLEKQVGDKVTATTPGGEVVYEITAIK